MSTIYSKVSRVPRTTPNISGVGMLSTRTVVLDLALNKIVFHYLGTPIVLENEILPVGAWPVVVQLPP